MTAESYLKQFEKVKNLSEHYQESKQKSKDISDLTIKISNITTALHQNLSCADVFRAVYPSETEISENYYIVIDHAGRIADTYKSLFGNELERVSGIKNTSELKDENDGLSGDIETLSNAINGVHARKLKDFNEAERVYKKLSASDLLDEKKSKTYQEGLVKYSEFLKYFETRINGEKYIKAHGLEKAIEVGKSLLSKFEDIREDLYTLQSEMPVLSSDAEELVTKLDSGKRVLLRDLDVELLSEIKKKRPDLGTKVMVKFL